MSTEVRRISLKAVPIVSTTEVVNKSEKKKSKDPKTPKEPKTKRFVLDLNTESEKCNEFSFNDLIKAYDQKIVEPTSDQSDPLTTNEDEQCLKDLEKHFQKKYGPKKRKRMEDYIDKGMGYDETDPFIDNEEAYDELVPSTLTTKYGGFYINCGSLEFRPLSPEKDNEVEDDEEDNIRPVIVKRKRKIELIEAKRRRSTELKSKKNKMQIPNKTVAQMIQQKKSTKPNASDNSDEIEEIEIIDTDSNEAVVSTSVRDVIDSVAKGEEPTNGETKIVPIQEKNLSNPERNLSNGSSDGEDLSKKDNSVAVKLPEGLPEELLGLIVKIKKLAQTSHDGKRNFFNEEVNQLLFEIERKCRVLAQTNRTQVYSHLATHLPCSKQTLMSRAKKISTEAFDYELQTALTNIRLLVDVLTPRVFDNYQKLMEEAKLKFENRQTGTEPESPVKVPRKVFIFSSELKKQLNSAVTAKLNLYDQLGSKGHSISLKDYLNEFLDKDIKAVFPKGWMTLEVLKHKVKWIKQILPPETKQSTSPPSQSLSQPPSQSSQPTAPPNHLSPQSQANRVPTQQTPNERQSKSQAMVTEKTNNSMDQKLTANTVIKTVSNSYQMSNKLNENLSEGLVSKFISTQKEVICVPNNEAINMTSIDLTIKARSYTPPFITPSNDSPMNLKTSPNQMNVKSDSMKSSSPSSSPSISALCGIRGQSYKSGDKLDKMSHEACLTKVIEQSLGDYPNSSANNNPNSQRNSKSASLPLTPLPFNEMFAKGFNSSANKDIKPEICIEIASSPEPYNRVQQKPQQSSGPKQQTSLTPQQFSYLPKTSTPQHSQPKLTVSSSNSASNMSYMRNSELPKKKYTSSGSISLIQSSNAQKEQELRSNVSKNEKMQPNRESTPNRNSSRDNSLTITPIPNKPSDNIVNTIKQNSYQQNSRHSVSSTSPVTSTTTTYNADASNTYMDMFQNYLRSVNGLSNPIRFMDYSPLYGPSQSQQNMFYPYTSNTSSNKSKDK